VALCNSLDNYSASVIGEYVRSRNGSQPGVTFAEPGMALQVPGFNDTGEISHRRGLSPGVCNPIKSRACSRILFSQLAISPADRRNPPSSNHPPRPCGGHYQQGSLSLKSLTN
jgi:hypothetical protein